MLPGEDPNPYAAPATQAGPPEEPGPVVAVGCALQCLGFGLALFTAVSRHVESAAEAAGPGRGPFFWYDVPGMIGASPFVAFRW